MRPATVFAQNVPQPVTLYPEGPWSWSVTKDVWSPYPLPTGASFLYNGTDSMFLEFQFSGGVAANNRPWPGNTPEPLRQ